MHWLGICLGPFLAVFLLVNARGAGLQGIVYIVLRCHLHSQCQDEEKPHSSLHVQHMALPDAAQLLLMKPAPSSSSAAKTGECIIWFLCAFVGCHMSKDPLAGHEPN